MNNTKIVFFGSGEDTLSIIKTLNTYFNLVLVVTTEQHPTSIVSSYCKKHTIDYLSLQQFNNLVIQQLKELNAPLAALASFGMIIPPEVLSIFPKGILNIHPSLLPKYRGPTPVQTALLNGDATTGVSIIKLDDELDHGPLLAQEESTIQPSDTSDSLYKCLFKQGADLLIQKIPEYLQGSLSLIEQDHQHATYTNRLSKQDGFINLEKPPKNLKNMIRAYHPWPGVWTKLEIENGKWKILKLLPEDKIQVEGKKPMTYKDFLNGYPKLTKVVLLLQR